MSESTVASTDTLFSERIIFIILSIAKLLPEIVYFVPLMKLSWSGVIILGSAALL